MSKHLTYSDWRYQIQDHDSSPNGCHPDCSACAAEESLEVLLHNDQPPTCPKCGARMREIDCQVEGVHVCNNAACDYICRFENDEEEDSTYYVDLPNPECREDGDDAKAWIHVATFNSRQEAEQFLEKRYGIHPIYADAFLTEGRRV